MSRAGSSAPVSAGVKVSLGGADQVPEAAGLAVAGDDVAQIVEVRADRFNQVPASGVGDERARPAVGEPERERVGAEQHRERQGHRPELVDRDMGHDGLDALGKDDPDPVPAPDADPGQCVGKPIAEPLQIREREGPLRARRVLEVQRDAIADVRMPIADVDADVVAPGDVPPEPFPDPVEGEVRRLQQAACGRSCGVVRPLCRTGDRV